MFKKKYYVSGLVGLVSLASVSLFLYSNSAIISSRFDYTLNALESKKLDKTSSESSTIRILIWEQAFDLIRKNLLIGVGTGDIKDMLVEKYKQEGMTGAYDHKLNAHNQFLQTTLALGLPGLILIFGLLFIPLFKKNYTTFLTISFIIIIILNFLVESMLEIQAGTIFFSFFYSTLLSTKIKQV